MNLRHKYSIANTTKRYNLGSIFDVIVAEIFFIITNYELL